MYILYTENEMEPNAIHKQIYKQFNAAKPI